jgi:hypothetical protein
MQEGTPTRPNSSFEGRIEIFRGDRRWEAIQKAADLHGGLDGIENLAIWDSN